MKNELSISDKELLKSNAELKKAWVLQIEKDLGATLHLSATLPDWQEVVENIQRILGEKFTISEGQVPELLYRIDISENRLQAEMQSGKWRDWHELLAYAIAEREALKVIFRFTYTPKA